jgi:hypothetical protein
MITSEVSWNEPELLHEVRDDADPEVDVGDRPEEANQAQAFTPSAPVPGRLRDRDQQPVPIITGPTGSDECL